MKTDKIFSLLTNKYWLLFSLSAAFLCFYAFNRGAADTWVHVTGFFVLLNLLSPKDNWRYFFNMPLLFVIAVFLLLILISFIIGSEVSHYRNITNIRETAILVLGIHCFCLKEENYHKCYWLFCILLVFTACWHAFFFYSAPVEYVQQFNKHVLSNFLIMVVPFLFFYLLTIKTYKQKHWLFPLLLLLLLVLTCLHILLKIQSRPAILGLFFSGFGVMLFFCKGQKKLWVLIGGIGIVGLMVITNYQNIFAEMKDLIIHISREERVVIWSDSLKMIATDNYWHILFGHGLGSFRYAFSDFSSVARYSQHVFPHNFFLQWVYESGLLGFGLITALLFFFGYVLTYIIRTTNSYPVTTFCKCLLVYYLAWLLHCGLTVGFFSNYTLYPFAYTIGGINGLFLAHQKKQTAGPVTSEKGRDGKAFWTRNFKQ